MTSEKPVLHAFKVRAGLKPPAGQEAFIDEKSYGIVAQDQEAAVVSAAELLPENWEIIEGSPTEIPVPKGWVPGKLYHIGDAE